MERLFIQLMYKSQFKKIDPYDWFCGPGSHMTQTPPVGGDKYLMNNLVLDHL